MNPGTCSEALVIIGFCSIMSLSQQRVRDREVVWDVWLRCRDLGARKSELSMVQNSEKHQTYVGQCRIASLEVVAADFHELLGVPPILQKVPTFWCDWISARPNEKHGMAAVDL